MNKPLLSCSLDELTDALGQVFLRASGGQGEVDKGQVQKHYVYGLQGIADLLGCSKSTAERVKKSGVLDAAISQVGKLIVVDADLAIDLIKVRSRHNRR